MNRSPLSVSLLEWQASVCKNWRRVRVVIGRWCWHSNWQSRAHTHKHIQTQRSSFLLQLPDLQTDLTTGASGHGKVIENNKDWTKLPLFPILPPNNRIMQQFPSQSFDVGKGRGRGNLQVRNLAVVSKLSGVKGGILYLSLHLQFDMAEGKTARIWDHRVILQHWCNTWKYLLSVPGGRLALFLFLLLSAVFSKGGHSVTSGALEPLNWRGSLLADGSKGRALSPGRWKTQNNTLY